MKFKFKESHVASGYSLVQYRYKSKFFYTAVKILRIKAGEEHINVPISLLVSVLDETSCIV